MSREDDPVDLVDSAGRSIGTATVGVAHRPPGQPHRAISVMVIGPDGRMLLQQRAAGKTRFAGRWANTCCGHPPPGADTEEFARRRLAEEIGLRLGRLEPAGTFTYRANDEESGYVENEYDHVYLGRVRQPAPPLRPEPTEVAAWAWVAPEPLRAALAGETRADAGRYVPWLHQLLLAVSSS